MKQNVAYLRVSTEAQTEKYGLDVQRQKITEYCEKNGVVIDKWYVDGGYSGAKLERPEINKLLEDAENGEIKAVYIYKLDRMSRDVIDTLTLLYKILPKYGVEIISMTEDLRFENPMDKIMVTMNAAMNQYEREIIYMRTRAGMVERVKKGYWMGGGRVPYGYYYDRNDGILHPKNGEAENVRKAFQMYADGYSTDRISKILGFKGDRIVLQILKRKSNIGLIEYKGEVYKGRHEPIVDEELFYRVQDCMAKRHNNAYVTDTNMLTGLCFCGVCGARMRYQKWGKYHRLVCYSTFKSGKTYMRRADTCSNIRPVSADIEKQVDEAIKQFAIDFTQKASENADSNKDLIQEQIDKANARAKKFYILYADSESENLLELAKEEEKKIEKLKKQLREENAKEKKSLSKNVEGIINAVSKWDNLTAQQKNKILKQCTDKIVITGDSVQIHFYVQ